MIVLKKLPNVNNLCICVLFRRICFIVGVWYLLSSIVEIVNEINEPSLQNLSPEEQTLVKRILRYRCPVTRMPAAEQMQTMSSAFIPQLLPHLKDPQSLTPAYHMRAGKRPYADVVIGIPTVKRDKESYLLVTLSYLVAGLSKKDTNSTLIILMVGETDLEYVDNTARKIKAIFPRQVESGLIELISPPASYYPDFDSLPLTLGDSQKRVKWRTKQNLDIVFLMAYAHSSGHFYLMLEDDVIAQKNYMQKIKRFIKWHTRSNPDWFCLEFGHMGGIGKLFRSTDLPHFITYIQLFFSDLPIDWLLENYLADKVCTIDKKAKACVMYKSKIKPEYWNFYLFQHIGLYSSLKGKIQQDTNFNFGTLSTYYPHPNPPLQSAKTTLKEYLNHTLKMAYEGSTFFWGYYPKKDDTMEFYFAQPTVMGRYFFRSGNFEHVSDIVKDCVVEVLPVNGNFTQIATFDEFGMVEGEVRKDIGPLTAIRLRILSNSAFWVILSEIDLRPPEPLSR